MRGSEPAYPYQSLVPKAEGGFVNLDEYGGVWPGMTIRESFALAAMQGIATRNERGYGHEPYSNMAVTAVCMADALLSALENEVQL